MIGIIAIEVVGAVYCPLYAADPQKRLQQLIQNTGSRIVFIHTMTRNKLKDIQLFCLNEWLMINESKDIHHINRQSSVNITPDNIAYVLFTSGSTGKPKAVSFL